MSPARLTFRISGWLGVRIVTCGADECGFIMRRIGFAWTTAEITARPAYREMIDTLRWEDML